MKTIFCSFLFVLVLAVNGIAQPIRFDKAVDYNDFIVSQQTKIGDAIKAFITTFTSTTDSAVIQEDRKKIVLQADSAVTRMKRLVGFGGDTAFKESAIRLYRFYASAARVDYDKLVRVTLDKKKNSDAIQHEINLIVQDLTAREKIVDTDFLNAQKAFAAKNNFTLGSDAPKSNQ